MECTPSDTRRAKFEYLSPIKSTMFWNVTQYNLVEVHWRFGRTYASIFRVEEQIE
jgi:hypothetical protein